MPIDGLFFNKLLTEIADDLIDAKINRIHQPDKNTVTMKLSRRQRGSFTLLLSTHPQNAGIHIATASKENPKSPPLFAMVLRKYLEGGHILSISQQGLDRVAELVIEGRNEIGEIEKKHLFLEIMGKHSNLILTDDSLSILGAMKQFGSSVSRYRQVLPHISYMPPPPQEKENPFLLEEEDFLNALLKSDFDTPIKKALYQQIQGLSPQTAEEILLRAHIEAKKVDEIGAYEGVQLFTALQNVLHHEIQPSLLYHDRELKDFYYFPPLREKGEIKTFDSLSILLDTYYSTKDKEGVFSSQKSNLRKVIEQIADKLAKKIKKQQQELDNATDGEKYKLYGDLISSYIYQIEAHAKETTLPNFYDEGKEITIPLAPEKSAAENAARYFRKYNKAKTAKNAIILHLTENREELRYLENLLDTIDRCEEERDLKEIRNEAISCGYLKEKGKKKKEKDDAPLPPHEIIIDNYTILIGRNNKQNDKLTLKIAEKDDLWFHTKDIPGSHVILRKRQNEDFPDHVILKAASFAAFHSKAKQSDKVQVDFTEVRQVKKPNGARPGMVIYFEQTTLLVKPENPLKEI